MQLRGSSHEMFKFAILASFINSLKMMNQKISNIFSINYSKRPKTGRPVFGVFKKRPVPKRFGFRTMSENRTFMSGFWTFGSIYS